MESRVQGAIAGRRSATGSGGKDLTSPLMVKTSRFGEIEVDADRIIAMTSPILGFSESRRFFLRPHHGPESPFLWLQSVENPALAFVVVPANLVDPGYRPEISPGDRQELEVEPGRDPELMVILTMYREAEQPRITANLLAPLALNVEKRLAKQILLDPAEYDIASPLE